ncbi:peptidoglycan-binding protein [Streptomyces nitrosporeus]|uniref:peptidoglycan-binding protein n=1 Tax=Streptomyces nitrosporeus TaxID=28894 RepID=UPI003328601E
MRPDRGDQPPAHPLPEVTALLRALQQVKESRDLSLDAFTRDTGYSRSSWNRVLKGTAFPPRPAVERLCSRRGLDKDMLLGLWDEADRARRAAGGQEENPAADTAPAPAQPDHTPPAPAQAAPAPAQPDPTPPAEPDAPAPEPTSAAPAPVPSTPGPLKPAQGGKTAGSRSRIKTLALIAAALAALLLAGRWYSLHEQKEDPVFSQPETGGDNRPDDDQPVAGESPKPSKSSAAPTTAPTTAPAAAPSDEENNKNQDQEDSKAQGEEDPDSSPRPSSPAKSQTTSAAPPSQTTSLGAAGRANCRYNWDRTQTMAKGMVGSKVKQIQCLLNSNYDYTLTVDGKFGESTDVAVRAVQTCSGLKADGQVGPQTWKYLDTPMAGCGH